MSKIFYSVPKQVSFFDAALYEIEFGESDGIIEKDEVKDIAKFYTGGIAYQDIVICACCGAALEIADIVSETPAGWKPIIDTPNWVGFEDKDYFIDIDNPYWEDKD